MPTTLRDEIKQVRPFVSPEQEVYLGLLVAADRIAGPWAQFLKARAHLTMSQYNVLRILRGSHPGNLTCSEIATRMVARDPDVTRLVDRLTTRGLARRARSTRDRRVVEVGITARGLGALTRLDESAKRMPKALVGHLGTPKLRRLKGLLDLVISELGTFP